MFFVLNWAENGLKHVKICRFEQIFGLNTEYAFKVDLVAMTAV